MTATTLMPTHYFRLRSSASLLGPHKELESQTIYFAAPEELNDPMEGFRDLFWQGDEIVWTNLLKHYLRCAQFAFAKPTTYVGPFGWADIPVEEPAYDNKPLADKLQEKVFTLFFAQPAIQEFIKGLALAKHLIRRDELSSYIRVIHPFVTLIIQKIFAENKLAPPLNVPSEVWTSCADALLTLPLTLRQIEEAANDRGSEREIADIVFSSTRKALMQIDLIEEYNRRESSGVHDAPNKNFFFVRFRNEYVAQLDRLAYQKWHAACFMSEIDNASLWGSYGDGHSGAALKFKASAGSTLPTLGLHGVIGWSSTQEEPLRGIIQHEFHPITYGRAHVAIDFFASIGVMPMPKLNKYWYLDGKGGRSTRASAINNDESAWRKQYWDNSSQIWSTKSNDWKHENEHRLILFASSLVSPANSKAERALRYDFKNLDGIVFGLKMSGDDKLAIMRIVEQKCRAENRSDFNFYQSAFSSSKGTMEHYLLTHLRF